MGGDVLRDPSANLSIKKNSGMYVYMHLVAQDLPFGIILEIAVPLEAPFDDLAELGCEGVLVEEVVHPEARTRGLA